MKLGFPSKKKWYCTQEELNNRFNPMRTQLNRLMILDTLWQKLVGEKSKFWVLSAVQEGTLFVQVRAAVAKNELNARKSQLIAELNKYFEKPWIEQIKIK